jgi:xanthine dehydrogenase FAD-binding subunit
MNWNHYLVPNNIDEALAALAGATGTACPIGGGTDLLLDIQQGHHPPVDTLVDVTRIPETTRLSIQDGHLYIGAGVPVSQVAESGLVWEHAPAVCEACALIGGPQVRNTATLGGNVAHALPAADGMISLVAMDAEVEIACSGGLRRAPILSLFRGPGQSTLDLTREILLGFWIDLRIASRGSAFSRVMRPQGVALPILNMAAWIHREGDRIAGVRIAVGPAGPTPQRARSVEDFLKNCVYNPANLRAALEVWEISMRFRTSPQRATAEYRKHLCGVLLNDVMENAWQRTFQPAGEG